jgi:hypothetical protein
LAKKSIKPFEWLLCYNRKKKDYKVNLEIMYFQKFIGDSRHAGSKSLFECLKGKRGFGRDKFL